MENRKILLYTGIKILSYDLICIENYLNLMFYVITRIGENKQDTLWTELNF